MLRGNTITRSSMFKCRQCGSTQFKLMLQPSFEGQVDISTNENHEVVVQVNGKEFIADLLFMNQFAICRECEAIKSWEYHFPKNSAAAQDE